MKIKMSFLVTILALSAGFAAAQSRPATGFDQMKTLVGEWEARTKDGKEVHASYRLVSAGTALLETLRPPDASEMVTVYHADGDRMALTHYCRANNQPRMRTAPVTDPVKQLTFSFAGISNAASPETGHMHQLQLTFDDKDHFTQEWTWREKGQERTETFQFTRMR